MARPVLEPFSVTKHVEVGTVIPGDGDLPPGVAAFSIIDDDAASTGEDSRYEFQHPYGPKVAVEFTFPTDTSQRKG